MPEKKNIFNITKTWAIGCHFPLWSEESTESTNMAAKEEALKIDEDFKLYLAGIQTGGRGRGEHHWTSPKKDTALLSSWSYTPTEPPQHLTSPLFGLALFQAAQQTWPDLNWSLKAPNDLFIGDKKVAGLLIETVIQGDSIRLIVGLGLNVTNTPPNIETATCLSEHTQVDLSEQSNWTEFLTVLTSTFSNALKSCGAHHFSDDQRTEIRQALNKNPLLLEKIKDVSPDGDLITEHQTLKWKDL